jgi:hypothetical protein
MRTGDRGHVGGQKESVDDARDAFLASLFQGFAFSVADGTAPALHQALDSFGRAALLDDTRPEPYIGLGMCFGLLGDDGRAVRHFDACLERGFGRAPFEEVVYEFEDDSGETLEVQLGLNQILAWRAGALLSLERADQAEKDIAPLQEVGEGDLQAEVAVLRAKVSLARGDASGAQPSWLPFASA